MQDKPKEDRSLHGCFFAIEDYGSVSRRALLLMVDTTVLLVVLTLIYIIATMFGLGEEEAIVVLVAGAFVFVYLYFVELERRPFGTLGSRLTGLEVVKLNGLRPSRLDMTIRLGMAWLGPGNFLLDLAWIPSDDHRQTLRDKFAGTYVIKKGRAPAGHGKVECVQYFFLGFNWAFREVVRPK